ncbi:hypothetical protein [Streptomyces flavofungini]|uniref:Uncharacterized protein n=1 Tax=Streptomyces flavofungini TaxID=68200 RepID=A0ABS0XIY1_9ACTN|nr:hypothetical protein [Streptomyces flavofungini]MBJ3813187.1 hypothetical protein [Streptomyces flavofungini]
MRSSPHRLRSWVQVRGKAIQERRSLSPGQHELDVPLVLIERVQGERHTHLAGPRVDIDRGVSAG